MKLVLPYPVSANRYWRTVVNRKTGRAMTFVSKEAESYKEAARLKALLAGIRKPLAGAVELRFRLVPKNGICMDLDNALKVSIDALKGIAFADDSLVYRVLAEKCDPDPVGGARLEVEILTLALPTALLPELPAKLEPREVEELPF